jgi:hypothetical protein
MEEGVTVQSHIYCQRSLAGPVQPIPPNPVAICVLKIGSQTPAPLASYNSLYIRQPEIAQSDENDPIPRDG